MVHMEIRTERLFASGASPTVFGAHLFHGVCGNTLTARSGRAGARRAVYPPVRTVSPPNKLHPCFARVPARNLGLGTDGY